MYKIKRFGKVIVERFLGRSTLEKTKQDAMSQFGKGIILERIL